ncbi:MAG: hypothetical protein EBU90_28350, partial [Proteobacteria bacterium]|nr:hypothetical protein [Pseudomonadota bacterium]
MTNKALQKILTKNCEEIVELVQEMYNALEDYGDDEVSDISAEWLNLIEQCAGADQPTGDLNSTLHDTLEQLNNIEE